MATKTKKKGKMFRHPGVSLDDGFEEDFKKILNLFCAKDSYNFSSFAEIWNETNFNLIFCGRETVAVVEEFTEDIVKILFRYLMSDKSNHLTKVCSIYMMHALYHKQPCGIKPSVRVIPENVSRLKSIKDELKKPEYIQAQFVLCSLLRDGFFRFVMTEHAYGLEKPYRKWIEDKKTHKEELTEVFSVSQALNNLFESDDIGFDASEKIFDEYFNAKTEIPGSKNGEPPTELQLVKNDFIKKLRESVDQIMQGGDLFLGKKEIILRRDRGTKKTFKNKLTELREKSCDDQPSTSKKKKSERISLQKTILMDYCQMLEDSENIDTSDMSSGDEDYKDMPDMEEED